MADSPSAAVRRYLALIGLAVAAALTLWRLHALWDTGYEIRSLDFAERVAAGDWQASSESERRWLLWGWGPSELHERLVRRAQSLAARGSTSDLIVRLPNADAHGFRAQAFFNYWVPTAQVVAVEEALAHDGADASPPPPASTTVVTIDEQAPMPRLVAHDEPRWGLALGLALALLLGWLWLPANSGLSSWGLWPLRLVLGLTLITVATALVVFSSLPLTRLSLAATDIVLLVVSVAWWRHLEQREPLDADDIVSAPRQRIASLWAAPLSVALLPCLWKTASMPLWSWDHFAVWGLKGRRIVSAAGDLGFLSSPTFDYANQQYPLGYPLLLAALGSGELPTPWVAKCLHALLVVATTLLVFEVAARWQGALTAVLIAAVVPLSPLGWSTELVGLADPAVALLALAFVSIALLETGRRPLTGIAALLLGALVWVKVEALPLAVLLWLASVAMVSDRRAGKVRKLDVFSFSTAAGLAAGAGTAALVRWRCLGVSTSFFDAGWPARGIERLKEPLVILRPVVADLLHREWLGLWLLFSLAMLYAIVRRHWRAAALGAVVVLQLALYTFTFFVTLYDPAQHIASAFQRVAIVLLPLSLIALSLASRPPSATIDP